MKTNLLVFFGIAVFLCTSFNSAVAQNKDTCIVKLKINKGSGQVVIDTTIVFNNLFQIKNIDSIVQKMGNDLKEIQMDIDIQMNIDSMSETIITGLDDSLFIKEFSTDPEKDVVMKKYFKHKNHPYLFEKEDFRKGGKKHKHHILRNDTEDYFFDDIDQGEKNSKTIIITDDEISITQGRNGKTIIIENEKKSGKCKKHKKADKVKIIITEGEEND